MPLVEQELLILLDPLSSPLIFSGVRVTQSLVFCVMLVDCCLSFCLFSFGHCVVCSSIYRFWLPLWYLQTLLDNSYIIQICFLTPCELWTPCKRNNFLVCFQSFLPCSGRQIFAGMTEKKIMINKNGITDLQHKVQHSFRKLC